LLVDEVKSVEQGKQLENPDMAIQFVNKDYSQMLSFFSSPYHGISTTDYAFFGKYYWELRIVSDDWIFQQSTIRTTDFFSGKQKVLLWEKGEGKLKERQKTKAPVHR
jgi:hypothetical protein